MVTVAPAPPSKATNPLRLKTLSYFRVSFSFLLCYPQPHQSSFSTPQEESGRHLAWVITVAKTGGKTRSIKHGEHRQHEHEVGAIIADGKVSIAVVAVSEAFL